MILFSHQKRRDIGGTSMYCNSGILNSLSELSDISRQEEAKHNNQHTIEHSA